MITFDGLVFKGDGWNDLLAASELDAVHVTVADFLGGYRQTIDDIGEWHRRVARDSESLFVIRDLESLARIGEDERLGVLFGLQNAAPVAADLGRLERLWELDVRVVQLSYNEANLLADGCVESRNAGLSRQGRAFVRACNDIGMLIDLSHVGERSSLEAVELSEQPVAVTHANLSRLTPSPRNKSDEVMRAVAARGGIVGASTYGPLLWDGHAAPTLADFTRHVHGLLELVGEDSVTVGTDFPAVVDDDLGGIVGRSLALYPEVFAGFSAANGNGIAQRYCADLPSAASWPAIPAALLDSGLSAATTAKVVGGNWVRLLSELWSPPGS